MEKFIYRRRTAGVSHPEMLIEDFLRVNREIVLRGVVDSALLLGNENERATFFLYEFYICQLFLFTRSSLTFVVPGVCQG
jgi:hypothetical protein